VQREKARALLTRELQNVFVSFGDHQRHIELWQEGISCLVTEHATRADGHWWNQSLKHARFTPSFKRFWEGGF
jgi:hypothetical protein